MIYKEALLSFDEDAVTVHCTRETAENHA